MQLIAIDAQGQRIIAKEAQRKKDYHCPECTSIVRLRFGPQVQPHFYHYSQTTPCQHRKKSLAHLNNQLYLLSKLPLGEAILEHSFSSIGRIADVFWPAQSIVFEVQCSAMTASEAKKRECDYQGLGLKLIWILHEARYNRRQLSAAETIFVSRNAYYTSVDARGSGMIYDQFEIIREGRRCFKGARFPISPNLPYEPHLLKPPTPCSSVILQRLQSRTLGFTGDVLDAAFKNPDYDYSSLLALEKRYLQPTSSFRYWRQTVARTYRAFLYALLEKILTK